MESEKINIGGNEYYVSESHEWIRVITDSEGKIIAGIHKNGSTYIAELEGIDINSIKHEIQEYLEEITKNIKELDDTFKYIDSSDYVYVELDSSSKVLGYRDKYGALHENSGIITNKVEIEENVTFATGQNDWIKLFIDSDEKIIGGIKSDGCIDWFDGVPRPIDVRLKKLENEQINIKDIKNVVDSKNLIKLDTVKDDAHIIDYIEKLPSEDGIYVGYVARFEQDTMIDSFNIGLYNASDSDINTYFDFYIGTVDQRNWFLPRITLKKKVTYVNNGIVEFNFKDDKIILRNGDVIFIYAHPTVNASDEGSNKVVCIYENGQRHYVLHKTNNILNSITPITSTMTNFPDAMVYISYYKFDSIFQDKDSFSTLSENVDNINTKLSKKQNTIIEDRTNGEKYKIVIYNGEIKLKNVKYKKVLCIGNSYTGGWNNRTLCSTTDTCAYYEHMKRVMDASVMDHGTWVEVERQLTHADFNNIPYKNNDYDAILLQLGENVTSTDYNEVYNGFRMAYKALKQNWPIADVYSVFGRLWGNRPNHICMALENAASDEDVPLVDCSDVSLVDHLLLCDFACSINGGYDEAWSAAYASHPSDVGCYRMAERILGMMGYPTEIPNRLFNVNKHQTTGGTIKIFANYAISEGLVTVQCFPDNGYEISNVNVIDLNGNTIETTRLVNSLGVVCYVFIMPENEVNVNPEYNKID